MTTCHSTFLTVECPFVLVLVYSSFLPTQSLLRFETPILRNLLILALWDLPILPPRIPIPVSCLRPVSKLLNEITMRPTCLGFVPNIIALSNAQTTCQQTYVIVLMTLFLMALTQITPLRELVSAPFCCLI